VTWKARRSGRRQHRQWAMAWSMEPGAAGIAESKRYGYEVLEGQRGLRFEAPFAISRKRIAARTRTGIIPCDPG
jgi:hypothetical protein